MILSNKLVYLSGPIDAAADGGIGWRRSIARWITVRGGVPLDPTAKSEQRGHEKRLAWREQGKFDELASAMREIAAIDLAMLARADLVILHVDTNTFSCGTFDEIGQACEQHKPVLVHCQQGKAGVPLWLWGRLNHNNFFGDWAELQNYLEN
jgi:nucleoside 2-deoxyribosyltransferase